MNPENSIFGSYFLQSCFSPGKKQRIFRSHSWFSSIKATTFRKSFQRFNISTVWGAKGSQSGCLFFIYDLKRDSAQIPLKIVSSDEQKQDLPQITL